MNLNMESIKQENVADDFAIYTEVLGNSKSSQNESCNSQAKKRDARRNLNADVITFANSQNEETADELFTFHDGNYLCLICGENCHDGVGLSAHLATHDIKVPNNTTGFTGDQVIKTEVSDDEFDEQLKTETELSETKKRRKAHSKKKNFECIVCSKKYASGKDM